MKPVRSLIVPVYRNEEFLPAVLEAARGIAAEVGGAMEVVFVVDGSPDGSERWLAENLPRFELPSQLISLEGKNRLAEEIIYEVEHTMPFEKKKKKRKPKAEEPSETKGAKSQAQADGKEGKTRKSKAKEEPEEEEELPKRVLAVFFTHFIIQ